MTVPAWFVLYSGCGRQRSPSFTSLFMSTPATYTFFNEAPFPTSITTYLDLDGYPEGAANYFRAMLSVDEGSSLLAFLRQNVRSIILAGRDVWTSPVYRYSLNHMRLVAEKRLVERQDVWETIFDGDLLDFCNEQPGAMLHRVALFPEGRVGYYTTAQLGGYVSEASNRVSEAASEPGTPNLASAQRRLNFLKAVAVTAYQVEDGEVAMSPA